MSNRRWLALLDALVPPPDAPDAPDAPRPPLDDSDRQQLRDKLEGLVQKLAKPRDRPILNLQPDDIREVVQDVMCTILTPEEAARLRGLSSVEDSVKLLVNNAGRALKKANERLNLAMRTPLDIVPPARASDPRTVDIQLEWLRNEIDRLPPRDRRLLELRFRTGLTIAEIARQTGSRYSAVAARLFLLVRYLRSRLEPTP
jgi:DNA-directed RNA polymerase specialized sigma24 family protein